MSAAPQRLQAEPDDEEIVKWNDAYSASTTRRLSRLDKLLLRNVITPRQYDAALWLQARAEAYYSPGAPSLEDTASPYAGGADPTARWVRGQRTTTSSGKRRSPPPTFRPRRPGRTLASGDGWSAARCEALTDWVRAQRLLQTLDPYQARVVCLVVIDGLTIELAALRMLGGAGKLAGRVRKTATLALCEALDAIADETEGREAA